MTSGNLPTGCKAKSFITAGFMLLFVFLAMPAHAEKGQSAYKHGTDLEARQNYEGAYGAYQKAYDADPRNTRYRAALTTAVTKLYGPEQADLSTEDWLEESELMDSPPRSEARNWRAVTIAASARLANRVNVNGALGNATRSMDN